MLFIRNYAGMVELRCRLARPGAGRGVSTRALRPHIARVWSSFGEVCPTMTVINGPASTTVDSPDHGDVPRSTDFAETAWRNRATRIRANNQIEGEVSDASGTSEVAQTNVSTDAGFRCSTEIGRNCRLQVLADVSY